MAHPEYESSERLSNISRSHSSDMEAQRVELTHWFNSSKWSIEESRQLALDPQVRSGSTEETQLAHTMITHLKSAEQRGQATCLRSLNSQRFGNLPKITELKMES